MINMVIPIRPDYCPICDKNRVVELYDLFGNPLKITQLYDNDMLDILDRKDVSEMRCKSCNHSFKMLWVHKEYPIALEDNKDILKFLGKYIKGIKEI